MPTKTKTKQTFDVKTVDTPSDLVPTNQTQLFDYSSYSEEFKLNSYQRKARIKANEQVATKAFYDIAQDVKDQHDEMNNYQDWLDWCDKELGYKSTMSKQLLKIGEELGHCSDLKYLPESKNSLFALAESLSKVDEETKQKILDEVEAKTEETGKPLTEKQINELPEVKQLKEKLKAEQEAKKKLEEDLKETKQTSLFYEKVASEKLNEVNQLKETVDNQHKDIQKLNSDISQKENALKSIEQTKIEVETKKAELNEIIAKKANIIAEEKAQKELDRLKKKENELDKERAKIAKELKETQSLKTETEREKERFTRANKWVELMTEYNLEFAKMCDRLKYISTELNQVPKFEDLGELNEQMQKSAQLQMNKFSDNLDEFGKFNNRIIMGISRIDKNPLKAYEVTAEVIND